MRVLHICKSLNTALGGIQTHTRTLTRHLAQQGIEVDVLTGGAWRNEQTLDIPGVSVIPMRYLPGYRLRGLRRLGDDVAFNLQAKHWLLRNQKRYDLIHAQGRSGMWYVSSRWRTCPTVMTFHGLTRQEYRHARAQRWQSVDAWLHQCIIHRMERKAYRQADGIITVSSYMAGQLEAVFGPRRGGVRVIPNGVAVSPHQHVIPTRGSKMNRITFLGRIEENKGIRRLPALMHKLPPEITLRVIGTGRLLPWLKTAISQHQLQDRVEWIGSVPNEEVPQQIEGSLALLVPSIYEPQGLVVLEAFERNVPVLASDVGGLREMIRPGENGWLVQPDDVEAMATHLRELHEHPDMAALMGAAGRRLVGNQYQWTQLAARTIDLYQHLLWKGSG